MKKVKDRIENGGRSENNLCSIQDYIDFLYKMWKFFLFIKVREVWVSFFLVCIDEEEEEEVLQHLRKRHGKQWKYLFGQNKWLEICVVFF